ncbi:hypothetical protein [Flavobacterium sp. 123]|uniref:hypothetical protein n=1 Tax=Flavobacterium sp. 123 TaxID=2135627 RepID=UPI000EB5577D|nr:hypothetical protein [Flavobacterium sp. 123]RKS99485.1 hypothetical protein C8C88_1270 [Flavobacterium sp. 123]
MNKTLLIIISFLFSSLAHAQYANFEASTGGFSFIPAFTSNSPHLIINAGTNESKRLSFHTLSTVRLSNFTPRGVVLISRYKLIDKKLKVNIGVHLPAIQINDDDHVDTFFAQELIASYELSKKVSVGAFYLHGKGKNNDFEANFLSFNTNVVQGNFSFLSQLYGLDMDETYGVSETITYKINKNIDVRGFANKTISDGKFNWTLGARYNL